MLIKKKGDINKRSIVHTSSTVPVGNFQTPDPLNAPLFSWTTRSYNMKELQLHIKSKLLYINKQHQLSAKRLVEGDAES